MPANEAVRSYCGYSDCSLRTAGKSVKSEHAMGNEICEIASTGKMLAIVSQQTREMAD